MFSLIFVGVEENVTWEIEKYVIRNLHEQEWCGWDSAGQVYQLLPVSHVDISQPPDAW